MVDDFADIGFSSEPCDRVEHMVKVFCDKHEMKVRFGAGVITVKTFFSVWRIYNFDRRVYKLCHENYHNTACNKKRRNRKYEEGFHEHYLDFDDILQVLRYIYNHDKTSIEKMERIANADKAIREKLEG